MNKAISYSYPNNIIITVWIFITSFEYKWLRVRNEKKNSLEGLAFVIVILQAKDISVAVCSCYGFPTG